MSAPQEIIKLVERFERNHEAYISGVYNETQLRREFLDPFFEVLGWDVNNKKGYAEAYKDVIHEDAIKIGGYTKAPDYCFRIGGVRKFFVEAKKPSVNLKDEISPAFQLRRYAWSARLPLSILTDFEEFVVYDCRIKPDKTDKPSTARILYSTFTEYHTRWDEISSIFSPDAIFKGSFDKYAESSKGKKGTAEVDAAFLKEIESWRELLARNIALRNPTLTQRELNCAVQQTIDRIIFLRICEDRGIEEYNRLLSVLNGANVYQRLCQLFRRADEKYNSGLFHFTREKEREEPDELTLNLTIDDSPLKDIIKSLYYPDSPYEFSVLPADILGQVYEQFLGKVIRLTDGHRAVVEDKPEVKKAGGVYYTPTYIVDYIVKNTVGQLLGNATPLSPNLSKGELKGGTKSAFKKATPKEVSKLRILDPACGSGSFLIGAFQYLIDWHLQWYSANDPESWAKKKNSPIFHSPTHPLADSPNKNYRLTTAEKRRILLNNIYGVDIDPQAVEVTKLSLLLKVLEGESGETLSKQLKLFQERALPDLGNNIKCGNSLIGPDFYNTPNGKGGQRGVTLPLPFLDDEERYRINVFDWEKEFPEVFMSDKNPPQSPFKKGEKSSPPLVKEGKGGFVNPPLEKEGRGGFDAVIGNPPYVRQELLGNLKSYLQSHYKVYHGVADLYSYFIERGVSLLNEGGIFSYIVANKWMRANYGEPMRRWLKQQCIEEIIDFGDLPVFQTATTYPCILRISKNKPQRDLIVTQIDTLIFSSLEDYVSEHHNTIKQASLDDSGWSLGDQTTNELLEKLKKAGVSLKEYVQGKIYRGVLTGLNEAFVIDEETKKKLISADRKSVELIKPFLTGKDVKRYQQVLTDKYLIFARRGIDITKYPAVEKHLNQYKKRLMPKPKERQGDEWEGRKPGAYKWYEIQDTVDYYAELEKPKIVYPDISLKTNFTFDDNDNYCGNTVYFISSDDFYLLGILNSRLLTFLCEKMFSVYRGGYLRFFGQYLEPLPIRTINLSDPTDKARHDKMVKLVEQMLSLNKQLAAAKIAHEKTILQRQIDATDQQIDNLVYELYGLTEEEINIVENK